MTDIGLTASQVLDAVTSASTEQGGLPLRCFWVATNGDRERFVEELERLAPRFPLLGVVVRDEAFDDPNSLAQDVASVIVRSQERFVGERAQLLREAGRVHLVLVARRELRVASTASPIRLPSWFPVCPGESSYVGVVDLTWYADEPLSSPDLDMPLLRSLLFRLEKILVLRIGRTLESNSSLASALRERLCGTESALTLQDIVARATSAAAATTNPAHFRPAAGKSPDSLVGRLYREVNRTPFDGMSSAATALAAALRLASDTGRDTYEPLAVLLMRPSQPDIGCEPRVRFCRCLLLMMRSTLALSNGAAHADTYGRYSVNLMRSLSIDLRRGLREAAEILEGA